MRYEWDENKNKINQKKHGISFEEAATVFEREDSVIFDDPDHSIEEERFLIIGFSCVLNLLVVCWCERANESLRIISARQATAHETEQFFEFTGW